MSKYRLGTDNDAKIEAETECRIALLEAKVGRALLDRSQLRLAGGPRAPVVRLAPVSEASSEPRKIDGAACYRLHDEGETYAMIARRFDCSTYAARDNAWRHAMASGLTWPPPREAVTSRRAKSTEINGEQAYQLAKRHSWHAVGAMLNCHAVAAHRAAYRYATMNRRQWPLKNRPRGCGVGAGAL